MTADATPRFRIGDVRPAPSSDVLAAITVALDQAWPATIAPDRWAPPPETTSWRFGHRRWVDPPIPLRRWGVSR